MFSFGKASMRHILTLHEDLQAVLLEDIKTAPIDYCVYCGHRGEKAQNAAYDAKKSEVRWPDGKHNKIPSEALDFAPYYKKNPHIRWENVSDFVKVAKHIIATGKRMGVELHSGRDWDKDGVYNEKGEIDGPHIEKVTKKTKPTKED